MKHATDNLLASLSSLTSVSDVSDQQEEDTSKPFFNPTNKLLDRIKDIESKIILPSEITENMRRAEERQKIKEESEKYHPNKGKGKKNENQGLLDGLQNAMEGQRALQQANMGLINEYGCWCYFEEGIFSAKGTPVDEIDEICKKLIHGYECIMMEYDCTPWEIGYESAVGSGFSPHGLNVDNLRAECAALNGGSTGCEYATCTVEGWFVMNWLRYAMFGGTIDYSMRHAEGFDPEANCHGPGIGTTKAPNSDDDNGTADPNDPFAPIVPSGGNDDNDGNGNIPGTNPEDGVPSKQCCSIYPEKFPYHHNDAHKCCVNHTYNPNLFYCCDDGSVQFSCL